MRRLGQGMIVGMLALCVGSLNFNCGANKDSDGYCVDPTDPRCRPDGSVIDNDADAAINPDANPDAADGQSPICGNGIVETGEACDDGNQSNGDGCLNSCREASCGDGYLQVGVEECDDGNNVAGDGCAPDCSIEPPVCGNGIREGNEECDDGNQSNTDECLNNCTLATCGDGYVWLGFEECDDGNLDPNDGCDANCFSETFDCGNGIVEPGEMCDDGNLSNTDACLNSCHSASCGDGFVHVGVEQCDDGNGVAGDGCAPDCTVEQPTCGNGIVEVGEACDDANASNQDACLNTCTAAVCGDGYVRLGTEECDDGNTTNGDGCNSQCRWETGVCGNGVVEAPEQCDDGNLSNGDACLVTCQPNTCGDSFLNVGVEECDDGNTQPGDGCASDCTIEPGVCGNGIPDAGEQCDDGNTSNSDACVAGCLTATCGDGYVWLGFEECDDGNNANGDGCDSTCHWESGVCGDGTVTPPEECDDGNLSNQDDCLNSCHAAICGDGFLNVVGGEQCDDGNIDPNDACDPGCEIEAPNCGDGVLQAGEQCDCGTDPANLPVGCTQVNSDAAPDACRTNCLSHTCGDGVPDTGEVCDDGNTANGDGCNSVCGLENCNGGTPNGICEGGLGENHINCPDDCTCLPTNGGVEICDGIDNDCDGQIDEGLVVPPAALQSGVCAGQVKVCMGTSGWVEPDYTAIPGYEPVWELTCDGLDNDCDGTADNGLIPLPAANQNGVCAGSLQVCQGTQGWQNPNLSTITGYEPTEVSCDGLDNDCDGTPDNGLSAPLADNQFGVCAGSLKICQGPLRWQNPPLTSIPGYQSTEVSCDNIDNDCDGQVDENLTRNCYDGAAGTEGVGPCHGGTQTCSAGSWGACQAQVIPVIEVCDGIDNNCDGQIDNGLTAPPADKQSGVCAGATKVCNGTDWVEPNYMVIPAYQSEEGACDGLDNDCDGLIDENITRACYGGPAGTEGVGVCHGGTQTCNLGAWSGCVGEVQPSAETCNGVDDDCDGQTDEGLGTTTCGLGVCNHTIPVCVNGVVQTCDPMAGAGPEICDGLDNDCDGQVDEDSGGNPLARSCYTGPAGTNGVGQCQSGSQVCGGGAWGVCIGDITPLPEICDGLDNDCDNQIDEGLGTTTCGAGQCQHTINNCVGGVPQTCNPFQGATTEVCDGVDNDCDGQIDENLTMNCYDGPAGTDGVGTCHGGTRTCTAGTWGSCQGQVLPATETCDGQDDNCDGWIDRTGPTGWITQPCYGGPAGTNNVGICHSGTQTCTGGVFGVCVGEQTPLAETCNGQDDDCDGQIDEGLGTTTCGVGQCQHTINNCVGGAVQTCNPFQGATSEICDGVDNDCDGSVDEDSNGLPLSQSCYTGPAGTNGVGQCHSGSQVCGGGVWGACVGDITPLPETCNDGLDNDCDGNTDCADPNCASDPACGGLPPTESDCSDGVDNDGDGDIDCSDTDCIGDPDCGESNCSDGVDNDGDGDTDCADSECWSDPACAGPEVCDDGVDNDLDNLTDCADPACAGAAVCQGSTAGCLTDCTPSQCSGLEFDNGTVQGVCLDGQVIPYIWSCPTEGADCDPGVGHPCGHTPTSGICEYFANIGVNRCICK